MKKPVKPAKAAVFKPVPVAAQRAAHRKAMRNFRPVPVKVQVARHKAAVRKNRHQHHKVRKWSPGQNVACCSAEALGTLLGLSGEDMLTLYFNTGPDPDAGASILATLHAGRQLLGTLTWEDVTSNICSRRSAAWPYPGLLGETVRDPRRLPLSGAGGAGVHVGAEPYALDAEQQAFGVTADFAAHGLILGVALPEPHSVAVTPDGTWWSWGEPFEPAAWPDLVIEEAWAIGP